VNDLVVEQADHGVAELVFASRRPELQSAGAARKQIDRVVERQLVGAGNTPGSFTDAGAIASDEG
jgi:hypothetical protein